MSVEFKSLGDAVAYIKKEAMVRPQDVIALRRFVFSDGVISASEAEELYSLARSGFACPEWLEFFVEAMTDYVVNQAEPKGYVSSQNANWLMDRIRASGEMPSALELETLVNVINKAKSCPETLSVFALEMVKQGVIKGEGALRRGAKLEPGVIGAAEVDLLRLVLYGMGGDGNIAISRAEAEVLFDINDIVGDQANHPSWPDLFVKAIANFLMASTGYNVPTRQEALRSQEWLDDDRASITDFLSKTFAGGLRGILNSYSVDEAWAKRNEKLKTSIKANEVVDAGEAQWLIDRVKRDGKIHKNERALLMFIKETSPDIHPELKAVLDQVA